MTAELAPEIVAHHDADGPSLSLDLTPGELRAELTRRIDRNFELFGLPGPGDVGVEDRLVALPGRDVRVRVYRPAAPAASLLPAFVQLHGGGWMSGSIDELISDAEARHGAAGAGAVVVAVEYRLAPEHAFPAGLDDCIGVVRWLAASAGELGVDPDRIVVGGASAGANLAAACPVAAPDLPIAGLLLHVPALDLTVGTVRSEAVDERDTVFAELLSAGVASYLGSSGVPASDPRVSPLFADLDGRGAGWPPTHVFTAGLDPLQYEGLRFVERLRAAGVRVWHDHYEGAEHGSAILAGVWETARRWHADGIEALRSLVRGEQR